MLALKQRLSVIFRALFLSCHFCGGETPVEMPVCAECLRHLPWIKSSCPVCATHTKNDAVCGRCVSHPPKFERVVAAFDYAPPIAQLIRDLKFGHHLVGARVLGELLAHFMRARGAMMPDIIVPVPTHITRLRQRGFNQSYELAKIIGRHLHRSVDTLNMTRGGPPQPQTALSQKQRLRLPQKYFSVARKPPPHVAVIDDVVTTGATANVVAAVLKRAGAERVDIWAVARTRQQDIIY